MTNDEVQEIIDRAEDEYDRLKDRVHDLYDENKQLKADLQEANDNATWWHNRWNSEHKQLGETSKRIGKAISILSKINYEDINEYIPPLEILPVYKILSGDDNERT